jgi:hypothetical protein
LLAGQFLIFFLLVLGQASPDLKGRDMPIFRSALPLLFAAFLTATPCLVASDQRPPVASFGALDTLSPEAARAKALAWLKEVGTDGPAALRAFDLIWKQDDRLIIDRLADTFALGSEAAAKLLAEARDPLSPAPTAMPLVLKDTKASVFFRANLALAYARSLSNRRVHEEALEALRVFRPEQVVDPVTYLFHRAVCEHALLKKAEASRTIARLLDDAGQAPERYRTVAALMLLDMQTWKDKDLGAVARKMENIERRLELARGGPETQKLQKEVIHRLDELIKELENKRKGDGPTGEDPGDGPSKPGPGNPGTPANPLERSQIVPGQKGDGTVREISLRKLAESWGRLPPGQQHEILQGLTRGMSPRHREAIENYFRNLSKSSKE